MKKLVLALAVILIAVTVTSCRTSKYGCPAVAGTKNAKPFKA